MGAEDIEGPESLHNSSHTLADWLVEHEQAVRSAPKPDGKAATA
jgi:hypothetical protein